jgi:hypothetical protein
MPNRNLWNKNVPRVEYDHRARDTRLRLEHIEHLLTRRDATGASRYFGLLPSLLGNIAGSIFNLRRNALNLTILRRASIRPAPGPGSAAVGGPSAIRAASSP